MTNNLNNGMKRMDFDDKAVINPDLVIKLGVVLDAYKLPYVNDIWEEAEAEVATKMEGFKPEEAFHQEEIKDGALWFSFRYYTPKTNVVVATVH